MKQKLLNKLWLRVGMIVAIMTTALSGTAWAETKTEGFETATAGTTYNSTQTYNSSSSDCGIGWTMYYGTVSTNAKISGSKSAQMRWYSSATSNRPYIKTTTAIDNLSKVEFKAKVGNTNVKMDVDYSTDGSNWTSVASGVTFSNTNVADFSYNIPSGGKYIKIGVSSSSTAPNSGNYNFIVDDVVFTYSSGGGGDTPTTYTVTYDANGATSGSVPTDNTSYSANASVTVLDNTGSLAKTDYTFAGWNTAADGTGTDYAAGATFTISANTTLYAQWEEQSGDAQWVLTSLSDLTASDVFVIVGNGYAMTNDNGTGSAPATSAVTISGSAITSTVAANIKWNVSGNATDGYTFYPNGTTATWLYCNTTASSSSNNNMRVGTGDRKVFKLNSNNYLITNDTYTTRYLSIYNNADWRGYTNTSNGAVALSFYKKVTGGVIPPSITASNIEIAYDATGGSISYTIANSVEGGTLSAATTSDWLSLSSNYTSPIAFTCSANTTSTERTATVTLTYTYGDNETTTTDVTITQDGDPNVPGTENNPYTVAQARAAIDAGEGTQGVYATGIVTAIPTAYSTQYSNITFNFVDNVGDTEFLQAYRCVSTENADASTVAVGDVVVVKGNLTKYNSTYEFAQGCELVSLTHPAVAGPTFSPAEGIFGEPQTVTITCATEGSTIYYTTDGSVPTSESTEYTSPITVSSTMTIKAIAIKGEDQSLVTTATYTIFTFEDGVFFFEAKMNDYDSGVTTTSDSGSYIEEDHSWTAGNVTLVTSGKYRWWENDGTLRFYTHDPQSSMTISVPEGKIINKIVITGDSGFTSDCGTFSSGTWTGLSQTVVLTYNAESTQNVKKVTVTYGDVYQPETINLNSYGFASFASTSAVDFTNAEEYSAWAITNVSEANVITFEQITGPVAAGTGVILKGSVNASISPEYVATGENLQGNLLVGIVTGTNVVLGDYYGLKGNNFVPVATSTVPAGKALLPANLISTSGEAKVFTFVFEDNATGIRTIETVSAEEAAQIFDLSGRRLSKTQKGVNIVNGKKVLK